MITTIATSSCHHKDLYYPHQDLVKLRLVFDWRDAPEASPQGMCVWFYPIEGTEGAPRRFDFRGKEGGEIEIPAGKYHLIAYNNDTELSQFVPGNSFEQHYVFTRQGDILEGANMTGGSSTPRPPGTENERVFVSPDEIYGCHALDIDVSPQGVSYLHFPFAEKDPWVGLEPTVTEHVITLYPHDMLCLYTYEVRNVRNLDKAVRMCAALSGMSPVLYLGDESLGHETVTIPIEARKGDESTIVGSFLTFGHHEENGQPHRFSLYVWMRDGKKYHFGSKESNFDLTEQVHSAPDRRRVHLKIDRLDLPDADDPGDNFPIDPGADDWGEINETIYI